MKLLLVDDDAFLRDMYATKFKEEGHEVSAAKSGEEAIQILKDVSFDVVLLDMVMPGLTGTEVIERVRAEKIGGDPACIILSNQGEQSDIEGAQKAGAAGYIVKAEMIPSDVLRKVKEIESSYHGGS